MNYKNGKDYLHEATLTSPDIDNGTLDGALLGATRTNIQKGPAIVNSGFVGTVTAAASTTVTFSSAADAIVAGYDATNPVLGVTLISNALTRYIVSWANSTTCVVNSSVTWAGTAITSVQFPISFEVTSASPGVLKRATLADGTEYFDGNVGIGTTSPAARLQVEDDIADDSVGNLLILDSKNKGMGSGGAIQFQNDYVEAQIQMINTAAGESALAFLTDSGSLREKVRIKSNGNVGIGTTAPDKPLEINAATGGAVRLTYDDANGSASTYVDLSVDSSGNLSISPTGKTIIMPDAGKILWDISPATDNTYSGNAESITMGATVALGDVLYQKSSDSEWYLAKADSSTTMPGLRLAVAAGADGAASAAIKEGYVYKSTWTWTPGMPIYVSTTGTTGNTLTQTAPTPATYNAPVVVQQVGYAISATVIWFCPSLQTLEIGLDYVALGTADVTIYPAYLSSSPITFTGNHSSTQSLTLDTLSAADAGKTFTISKIGTGAGSLRLVLPTGCTAYSSASSSTSGGYVELNASARGTMTWRINSATDIQLVSADGSLTFSS